MSDSVSDANLEEEKPIDEKVFAGATLQIDNDDHQHNEVESNDLNESVTQDDDHDHATNLDQENQENADDVPAEIELSSFSRDQVGRGSVMGRASIRSTSSKISMRPRYIKPDSSAGSYYCYKERQFDMAIDVIKLATIIKSDLDGEIKSTWLLSEIDHWDCEREKIVVLTDYSMIVVKFNFLTNHIMEWRRIMLHIINKVIAGDLKYPNSSLMPDREHGGIRISWQKGQEGLSFGQKWNPWCTDIPWCTLTHHPLIYNQKENETVTYSVDEFFESLVMIASKVFTEKRPRETLTILESPIIIDSYASPLSMVFNQSSFGYNKDRNGISY